MAADIEDSRSARFALRCSSFAERWFPDSWVFAALAVIIVALATLAMGAKPTDAAMAFGDGFWSLIPFTMQMAFVVIGGYVVASSPPAVKLIDRLATHPEKRPLRRGLGGADFHGRLAAELGPVAGVWRFAGARPRPPHRSENGLPRRRCRRLSGPRRGVGPGPVVVRRAIAGQPGQPAAVDPVDHRGDSFHPNDLSLAVRCHVAGADRDLADHCLRHRPRPELGA